MRFDRVDQAEGLRRLLMKNHTRVMTVVSGKSGVGRTSTTINLAAALVRSGKDVLVLDENQTPNNLLDQLGMSARYDLLDAVSGRCEPQQALLPKHGFCVLPTARAIASLARLDHVERKCMENSLTELSSGMDVILVDAAMHIQQAAIASRMPSSAALLVVADATTSGITESYALIKRLAQMNACLNFEIVLNKISNETEAAIVFGNMAKVARRNLAVHLEYSGFIPYDDKLMRATQLGRPVNEVFPAAISVGSYGKLSQRLLSLPVSRETVEADSCTILQSLAMYVAQPAQRLSREMKLVVN